MTIIMYLFNYKSRYYNYIALIIIYIIGVKYIIIFIDYDCK
jgi:putative Mn2+ efflux pump MntP